MVSRFYEITSTFKKYPGDKSISKIDPDFVEKLLSITKRIPNTIGLVARIQLLEANFTTIPLCPVCRKDLLKWSNGSWGETCSNICTCIKKYGVPNIASIKEKQEKRINAGRTKWFTSFEEEIKDFSTKLKYHGDAYFKKNYPILVNSALKIQGDYPLQGKLQLVLQDLKEAPRCKICNKKPCLWNKPTHSWRDVCSSRCIPQKINSLKDNIFCEENSEYKDYLQDDIHLNRYSLEEDEYPEEEKDEEDGYLKENILSIRIEGYLTEEKLINTLKSIIPQSDWIGTEVRVGDTLKRWDISFKIEDQIYAVEFDGYTHYKNSEQFKIDRLKGHYFIILDYIMKYI